jgi:hypothetical protein
LVGPIAPAGQPFSVWLKRMFEVVVTDLLALETHPAEEIGGPLSS